MAHTINAQTKETNDLTVDRGFGSDKTVLVLYEQSSETSSTGTYYLIHYTGWMDELGFYVPSTVFQSFRDDGRVNMKGSVQRSAV